MALTDEDEETLGKILASLERGASYDSRDARASAAALPRFGAVDASGDGSSSSSASVRRRSSLRSQNSLDSVTSALEKLVAGFESESQGTLSESFTKALQNTEAVVGLREELQSSEEALQEAKAQSEALASVQLEAERLEELATERQAERQVLKHELAALQEALKSSEDAVHLRDLKHAEVLQRSETVEAGLREALHQSEQALALAEQRNVQPMSPMSPDSTGTWRVASGVGKKNKMTTPRPDDGDVLETRETREVLRTLEALRTEEAKSEMLAKEKQCLQEELRTSEKAFCEKESNCMQISRHLEVLDASLKEAQQRTEDADKRLAAEQASFEEKLSLLQEELRSSEDALCEEASQRAQVVKSSEDLEARLKETLERKDEGNNERGAEQSQALHASLQEALQRTEDSDKRLAAEQASFEEQLSLLQEELRSSKEAICSEESKQAQAVEHSEALDARLKETLARKDEGNNKRDGESSELETLHTSLQEALQRTEDSDKRLAAEQTSFEEKLSVLQEELRSAEEALRQEESKRAQVDKSSEDSEASAKETLARTDEGNNKRDGEWSELETLHTSLQEALQRTEDADKRLVAEQTSFEEKLRLLQEELRSSEDALCEEASHRAQVVKSSEDLEARLKETLQGKEDAEKSLAVECSAFEEEVSAKWKLQEQLQQEQSLKEQHRLEGLKLSARQEELEKTEEMQSRRGVEREKKISELEATLQAKGERCLQTEQELHESARELQEAAESWQSSRRECSEREAQSEAKAGELWSEMGELRRELKAEQLKWQGEQRAYQDQAERQRHQLSVCEASMQQEMQRREDQVEVSQAQFRQLREQWRSERCSLRGQLRHASEELRESCARLCALQEQLASEEAQLAEMQSKFQHISQTCEAQDQMLSGGLRRALEEQGQAALAYHQKFQAKERQQQEIQSRRQKEWMQLKLVEEQQVKQLKLQLQHSEKACRMREEELEQQEEQRRNFEEEVLQHRLLCDQRMEECEEGLQLEMAQVREQTLIEARRRQEFAAEKQELLNELAVVRSTVEAQQRREEKHQEAWEAQQALHESLISRYEKAFASMKRKFQRDKAHLQARHEKESEESAADWLQLHSLIKPLICDQEAAAQLVTREVAAQTGRVLFQRFCDMKAEMKELQIEELSSQRTVVRESKKLLPGEGIGTGAASFGEKDAGKSRGCCLTYLDLAMPHVQVGDPSNSAQSSLLSRQCES